MIRWRAGSSRVGGKPRWRPPGPLVQHLVQLGELALVVIALDPSGPSLARSQPSQDRFSVSRWDRKADPGVPPALGNDHGIDADRLASPTDQRAAAVPRVDVRIRLDEAAVRLQFDLAIEGAHDADGGRLIKARGGADGHDGLAHV